LGVRAEPVELLPEPLLVPVKGQVAFLELVKREGLGALDAVVAAAEALGLLYRLFDAAFYEPDVGDADGEVVPVDVELEVHGLVFERARCDDLGLGGGDEQVGEAP